MSKIIQILMDILFGVLAYKLMNWINVKFLFNFHQETMVFWAIVITAIIAEMIEFSFSFKGNKR